MGLERDAIVGAALELLDEVGLEGLTTRRLAQALGIKGPSLYWHFKSKREMLDHMAEAIIAGVPPPAPESGKPWIEWFGEAAYSLRRAALSRRDGALIMMGQRPTGERPRLGYSAMVSGLQAAGFDAAEAEYALMGVSSYALGWAAAEQGAAERPTGIDYEAAFAFGLRAMLDGLAARLASKG